MNYKAEHHLIGLGVIAIILFLSWCGAKLYFLLFNKSRKLRKKRAKTDKQINFVPPRRRSNH